MKSAKENKPTGNIHKQQLFHWIGSDIDKENCNRKVLRDELVKKCLDNLRRSLEHGIWVKPPRVPEQIDFKGKPFLFNEPIACFTEWSLGESLPHTSEYGRIGFGFPKRWVIEHGGQPVTYFQHKQTGAFFKNAFQLLNAVGKYQDIAGWKAKTDNSGFDELRYLLHFSKMIREKTQTPQRKAVAPTEITTLKSTEKKKIPKAAVDAQNFKRKFGLRLDFVEEREWRIVYHSVNKKLFEKGPGTPTYYLPYVPGENLFTLVLPDNKVVSKVLQKDWFTERLFTPWKHYKQLNGRRVPPVTLLSHSDIGTF